MSEKQFYNTKIGKDLQKYKSKNYKSKDIEQRPAPDATEVEREGKGMCVRVTINSPIPKQPKIIAK